MKEEILKNIAELARNNFRENDSDWQSGKVSAKSYAEALFSARTEDEVERDTKLEISFRDYHQAVYCAIIAADHK